MKNRRDFWNGVYAESSRPPKGSPGTALRQFVGPLVPGRALELGCARGDDAVWLAKRGWTVTAVDVSSVALESAAENARAHDVETRIIFECCDLVDSFPGGVYDIVTASFLHSPEDWPRRAVLTRAAAAVAPDGYLFVVDHGSRAPWSWAPAETKYPSAEEALASLRLPASSWTRCVVASLERSATGPNAETATVLDNVLLLRRVSESQ